MKYSTSVPGDPDTHEDFKPTNKIQSSDVSLKDVVEQVGMPFSYVTCYIDKLIGTFVSFVAQKCSLSRRLWYY